MVMLVVLNGVGISLALGVAHNYVWDWLSLYQGGLVHA